jgi:hypothetical protein
MTEYVETRGGKVLIAGHVPIDTVLTIDAFAKAHESTRAAVMRRALVEWVAKHADELPEKAA